MYTEGKPAPTRLRRETVPPVYRRKASSLLFKEEKSSPHPYAGKASSHMSKEGNGPTLIRKEGRKDSSLPYTGESQLPLF